MDGPYIVLYYKCETLKMGFCDLQGYLFISVLVSASSDLMKLVIQSIKNDLANRNPVHINLALQCIANIGSREMAEALGQDIPKLLVSGYGLLYDLY